MWEMSVYFYFIVYIYPDCIFNLDAFICMYLLRSQNNVYIHVDLMKKVYISLFQNKSLLNFCCNCSHNAYARWHCYTLHFCSKGNNSWSDKIHQNWHDNPCPNSNRQVLYRVVLCILLRHVPKFAYVHNIWSMHAYPLTARYIFYIFIVC